MNRNLLVLGLVTILGQGVMAQSNNVEEVVVTATKTERTLQEVPVAVSVVTADTIEKANIVDLMDLKAVVPSLDARQYQSTTNATFFIRGFGNGSNNPGIEPSVAVFVDGVYRSKIQGQISDLPLVERIEVLRGPQSTLFGKNASAGVVNIVTKKPSFEQFTSMTTSFGNYNSKQAKIYNTGPLNETMAYSVSANINTRDGQSNNPTTGNKLNDRDRFGFRSELLITPADDLSIRITADYDEYDETCCVVGSTAYGVANQVAALLGGQVIPNDPFSQTAFFTFDPISNGENAGFSMHIEKNFSNTTLESITSYRTSDNYEVQDVDFDAADVIAPSPISKELSGMTQEIRWYSEDNDKVNWLVGGFYYQEDMDFNESIYFGSNWRTYIDAFVPGAISGVSAALGIPDALLFGAGQGNTETATQDNSTISLFAQADIQITDRLNALLGLSYIEDKKTVSYNQINTGIFSNLDFVGIGTLGLIAAGFPAAQAAVLATDPVYNQLLPLQALQFIPQFVNFPNAAQDGQSKDDNIDYTAKLSFALNDAVNIYGGISTGFKATAWNISRNSLPDATEQAALKAAGTPAGPNTGLGQRYASPEEAEVLELGAKIYLPNGYLNIAIFDQEIKGFQSNTFIGTGFVLANAGSQSADGVEFDLVFSPVESLDLAISGLFMDPIYDSFPASASGDLTGTVPSNVPEDTISSTATWNWNSGQYDGYVRFSHLYASEVKLVENVAWQAILDSKGNGRKKQDTLNFSAGINRGNFALTLWGKNINDDEFLTTVFPATADPSQTSFFGYPNAFKTYGLTLNYSF
ncbi:TonB-dependent receptor [Gammaproteobacteria bacterium]|nr:TonB-dependent receptor [Gammaproteobacteria bacterium]MDB9700787.1 TonB-dependent receptor [Gammaproteobacteria bacterium]MDC1326471.1 TonB-dependent receptor [Gammaproteobacteria bacterium]